MNEPALICRRNFLLGAAATLAAVSLPMVPIGERTVLLPSPHKFLRRRIYDLTVGFGLQAANISPHSLVADGYATVSVRRIGSPRALHQMPLNIRACYRWVAWDIGDMLLVTPEAPINLAVDFSRPELANIPTMIHLFGSDKVDEGPDIHLAERWLITDNIATMERLDFMEPDNSLEARMERLHQGQEALARAASSWSDDYDEEEYFDGDEDKPYHESFLSKVRAYIGRT